MRSFPSNRIEKHRGCCFLGQLRVKRGSEVRLCQLDFDIRRFLARDLFGSLRLNSSDLFGRSGLGK